MGLEEDTTNSGGRNDLETGSVDSIFLEYTRGKETDFPLTEPPTNEKQSSPSNSSSNAWDDDEFDGVDKVEKRESGGDSQENWSLGRLEEYKALQSSVKWMYFDIGFNLQDILLKCAGKGFKTFDG